MQIAKKRRPGGKKTRVCLLFSNLGFRNESTFKIMALSDILSPLLSKEAESQKNKWQIVHFPLGKSFLKRYI